MYGYGQPNAFPLLPPILLVFGTHTHTNTHTYTHSNTHTYTHTDDRDNSRCVSTHLNLNTFSSSQSWVSFNHYYSHPVPAQNRLGMPLSTSRFCTLSLKVALLHCFFKIRYQNGSFPLLYIIIWGVIFHCLRSFFSSSSLQVLTSPPPSPLHVADVSAE